MKTMYKFILIVVLLISSSAFAQTTYSWNGGNGDWSVATNWTPNGVPTATDNAVIAGTGTYTVTLDGDSTINDLTIGGTSGIQTLSLSSSTLTVNGSATINDSGHVSLLSSTLTGSGSLSNFRSISLNLSDIDLNFDNSGLINFYRSCNINGTFTTQTNSIIRLRSAYAYVSRPTFANGFTNNGLIEYITTYSGAHGILDVTSGTLVNAPGGTIHAPSTGSGINNLNAPLDNQGTIILDRSITINKASAVHTNSGTISINNGTLRLTQSGTSPSFTNTGILTVDSTTALTIDGGSFDYSSGTFTQNGSLTATNVAFTFTPAFTNAMNMSLSSSTLTCASTFTNLNSLSLSNSTLNGSGTFTNMGTMSANNSTIDLDFDNDGYASFARSCYINNGLTTQLNSTIRLSSAYAAGANLTIANGFTNNGLIEYRTSYINTAGTLNVTSGILVNAAGGTIHTPSAASSNNNLYAPLYNQGTIILDRSITINKASAVHSNSGTISINYGTLTLTGTSFENRLAGSLNGNGTIDVNNVTFTNEGIINPGTSAGALNITGNLPQDTSCEINIELGGTVAGSSYDQLNVSDHAILDGILNISLINSFIPVVGDTFEIMTFDTVSGMFTTINGLYTGTGVLFDLIPYSTSMQLVTTGAPNHPPILTNPMSNHFQDEDFGTIWVAHLDSVFDDTDISLGDSLTYQVLIEGNALTGAIINRELYIYSVSDSNGVVPVVVTATDMGLASVSDTFTVQIVPVNDAPSDFGLLEPQDQVVLTSTDTINFLWNNSIDVDNDPLEYELRIFESSWDTTFSNIADTSFEFFGGNIIQSNISYQWTVSVFDGLVTVASPDTFSFISSENQAPFVLNHINDMVLDEDFGGFIAVDLDTVFSDNDIPFGDTLDYSFAVLGDLITASFTGSELNLFSVSDSNGVTTVIVTATDAILASASDTFQVAINPVNDAPIAVNLLEPQHQAVLTSKDTINFLWSSSSDVDNDPLTYELCIFDAGWDTTINSIADTAFEYLDNGSLQLSTTYQWLITVFDGLVYITSTDTFSFTTPDPNGIDDIDNAIPKEFALRQNYPNPFNPTTTIEYDLPKSSQVKIEIYNLLGKRVITILDDYKNAGSYKLKIDSNNLASGVYFYRIQADTYTNSKKMILLR